MSDVGANYGYRPTEGYASSYGNTPYQNYGQTYDYGYSNEGNYSPYVYENNYESVYQETEPIYDERPVRSVGGTESAPLYIESKRPFPILAVILGIIVVVVIIGIILILIVKNKKKSLKNEYTAIKSTKYLTKGMKGKEAKDEKSEDVKAGKENKENPKVEKGNKNINLKGGGKEGNGDVPAKDAPAEPSV